MKKKVLISIITTTYNQEKFVRQCIDSVINQTNEQWEMIIVDDCSEDNTINIIKQYAKNNKSIKPILHKKNWGMKKITNSYNQALKIARGKYICILEGDDCWPSYKLEKQLGLHLQNSILSYGNCWIINQSNFIVNLYINLNKSRPTYYTPTLMINKIALEQIGGFQKSNNYSFWDLPTIFKLKKTGQIQYCNEILGIYRKHIKSNWLQYSYTQKKYKNTIFFRKINYWIVFNLPYFFLPRIIVKYSLYLIKKYIFRECKTILSIM